MTATKTAAKVADKAAAPVEHPTLAAALAAFQAECPPIRKGNTAKVPTKNGGSYSYDYADLSDVIEVVSPVLSRHGLSFNGRPTLSKHGFGLKYRLRHTSGESEKGFYPLPDPGRTDPQEQGKWQTYVRRYVLCAVVGVAPGGDDNDGAVSLPQPAQRPQPVERPRPAAKPAAAPKPDAEWLKRAEAATEKEEADVVWSALRSAIAEGDATVATADAVAALWQKRKAAAAAAPAEAAS